MTQTPLTADDLVRIVSIEALLRVAYSLTHRMHAATDADARAELREQRTVVSTEIIRRTTKGA